MNLQNYTDLTARMDALERRVDRLELEVFGKKPRSAGPSLPAPSAPRAVTLPDRPRRRGGFYALPEKAGRWTVLQKRVRGKQGLVRVRCECGTERQIRASAIFGKLEGKSYGSGGCADCAAKDPKKKENGRRGAAARWARHRAAKVERSKRELKGSPANLVVQRDRAVKLVAEALAKAFGQ